MATRQLTCSNSLTRFKKVDSPLSLWLASTKKHKGTLYPASAVATSRALLEVSKSRISKQAPEGQ
jgi:hypothetical protein